MSVCVCVCVCVCVMIINKPDDLEGGKRSGVEMTQIPSKSPTWGRRTVPEANGSLGTV